MLAFLAVGVLTYPPRKVVKGINPFRHSHYTLGENAISACGLKSATPVVSCVVANIKILIKFRFFDNLYGLPI